MTMKRQTYIFIVVLLLFWVQAVPALAQTEEPPQIEAKSAIVIDAKTGKVLYQKDADTKREPASTTKIITCMLALEHLELDQTVTVTGKMDKIGNVIGLKEGEEIKVEDLLYALMVYSANDAAVALAQEIGGSVPAFGKMMDEKAKACGAKNSHFLNPNGLNWKGQEAHLTTAYDLAVITKKAMENETFRKLVTTKKHVIPATNKSKARHLKSTNMLLVDSNETMSVNGEKRPMQYEGTIGVKTGLTSTAGNCFVGAVEKNGTELISVVLFSGDKARFAETAELWEYSIANFYDTHESVKKGDALEKVRVKRGAYRSVLSHAEEDAFATIPKGESSSDIRTEFVSKEVKAPVQKGQAVGLVKVYVGSKLVSQTNALAAETIEEGGPLSYFGIPDWMAILIYIALGIILAIIVVLMLLRRGRTTQQSKKGKAEKPKVNGKEKASEEKTEIKDTESNTEKLELEDKEKELEDKAETKDTENKAEKPEPEDQAKEKEPEEKIETKSTEGTITESKTDV